MTRAKLHTRYKLADGTVVPSVTTVIGENLGWNKNQLMAWQRRTLLAGEDPDKLRDQAADAGTLAHALIEQHIKHAPAVDEREWPPAIWEKAQTAFEAFLRWETEHQVGYLESELSLVSESYRYGGTIDILARIDGVDSILDVKTSNDVYPEHRIQLAAYQHLLREKTGLLPKARIIRLGKEDASFHYHDFDDLGAEWDAFRACLALHELRGRILRKG